MYKKSRIVAIIPARAGSKGIKNKNIINLCGKPLIAYTITAANESNYIDEVIVSTDGLNIAEVSKEYGASVPFIRPKELAADTSKTIDAVMHALLYLEDNNNNFDVLVLLQPTQPLRTSEEIDLAIEKYFEYGERALASISEVDDNPLLIREISTDGVMKPLLNENSTCRRQDMPKYYRINGAIYINKISEINKDTSFNDNPVPFIMSREHSVDIDEEKDLQLAEIYIKKNQIEI